MIWGTRNLFSLAGHATIAEVLIFILVWAALTFGYGFLAFALVANLFGREDTSNHLAGFAVAFSIWVALTVIAVRAVRARSRLQ